MTLDFELSDDQSSIGDVFGSFFEQKSAVDVVRSAEPLGFALDLWKALLELDAPGMRWPETDGGGGATVSHAVVVAEHLGRTLSPVPLLDHWSTAPLCTESDLVDGSSIATLAVRPADAGGTWSVVPAGAVADVVIGVDGDETVLVRSTPPGVALANHGDAPVAHRSTRDGERTVLGDAALLVDALDQWRVLTAAALVGIADRALAMTLEYVQERHQFGRAIGSFQAIQHGLADFPALIDGARFLVHKAAWAIDNDIRGQIDTELGLVDDASALASMAFLFASDAAVTCTDRGLHYHGGYGFSTEYDIQLYFRRARAWSGVLGSRSAERARVADLLWGTN